MKIFSAAVSLLALTVSLWAQGASSLRGTVTDPTKAVIATAKITLTDKDAGVARTTVSSAEGEYQFLQIRPGNYSVSIEAAGFGTKNISDVKLLVNTPTTLDVAMELASSSSSVSVMAEVAVLNTVDASVGNTFQEKQINSLPIQTRNVVQLLSYQPGVTQNGEVMGARRDQNNITLDGVDNNDNQNPLSGLNGASTNQGFNSALPVPLDSVQEFRVTVAGQGAGTGRSSGGQVSLVTRSGTNELHGSAYEYNRNTAYTANNWFNNRSGVARPALVRNQFGASLGGPIKKNRLFYFLNYERRIDASQASQTRLVPSEALKNGIISFKTTNGNTYTLNPSDIAAIDPLHIGVSPTMLSYLKQYPAINAPTLGTGNDGGLNFGGFIFNAPVKLDYRTYIGKVDWIVDDAGKHTVSFRGTLSNNGETNTNAPAQFPGQDAASQRISNNKGFALRYTTLLTPSMTNTASIGVTRIGSDQTGSTSPSLQLGLPTTLQNYTRGNSRINPTWNFTDEFNWVKARHTVTAGVNLRWIDNRLLGYTGSYPSYSFGRGTLLGLGNDIYTSALAYAANGATGLTLSNSTAVTNSFGTLLGLLNGVSATYQYQKDGTILPFGQPRLNDFVTRNSEFYLQDAWRVNSKLTVTYGVHYEYDTVPYEVNGLQAAPTPGLDVYFANRAGAAALGIPGNTLANSNKITYALNGPVNGKDSWYRPDKNNFAPRVALAFALDSKTVIRAGAGMTYDQFGNDLVNSVSSLGSVGLSTTVNAPTSYNFTTSPRYGTGVLPTLPSAPAGGFPVTPANISAISGTYFGISPDLKAPYTYLLNASVSRAIKDKYTFEVGYAGRLSRGSLIQQDAFAPAINFKDPTSGQTFTQSGTALAQLYNSGVTDAAVQKNPSLVPLNAFVENMFPKLTNYYFPGSASANYFHGVYGVNAGSYLDNLHQLDRITSTANPNCIVKTGCYTFFAPQGSADPTWTNAGNGNYHAMLVTFRHSLSSGFAFDLNWTWAHAIDNGSGAASGGGQFGGILQNVFTPSANRGDSAFDFRHLINANFVYQLPFGKGGRFSMHNKYTDYAFGGWQASGLVRIQSGANQNVGGSGVFNTNYWNGSGAYPINGIKPASGLQFDDKGNPSLFASGAAAAAMFRDAYPGDPGARNTFRLPWQRNVDLSVTKDFALPFEHHAMQFRADAYNVFNYVNFTGIGTSLTNPTTFGTFTSAQDARVLQLALRYTF